MSTCFWNVRGFNKNSKHSVVKELMKRGGFQFGCLIETKVREKKADKNCSESFPRLVTHIELCFPSPRENLGCMESKSWFNTFFYKFLDDHLLCVNERTTK